jgi:hypothetical protein
MLQTVLLSQTAGQVLGSASVNEVLLVFTLCESYIIWAVHAGHACSILMVLPTEPSGQRKP